MASSISKARPFPWNMTDYYRKEMGENLLRKFITFETLIAPDALASIKLATNALEISLSEGESPTSPRRVNLDPGYVDATKLRACFREGSGASFVSVARDLCRGHSLVLSWRVSSLCVYLSRLSMARNPCLSTPSTEALPRSTPNRQELGFTPVPANINLTERGSLFTFPVSSTQA